MINVGAGLGQSRVWGRIHDAAKEDDVDLLRDIVEARKGAPMRDINLPSASGLTPLHVAALSGSNSCVAYLLARSADIELVDSGRRLAMHWAAESGHTESVMHLVSAGQDMNLQDQDGNTPLHLAARNGIIGTAQYLIEVGADVSLRNDRGWTPFQAATVPMMRTVMEMLEKTLSDLNQIRRDHDSKRIEDFLFGCGMERYVRNVRLAGYTAVHLLDSCKPIRLSKFNEKITVEAEKMSHRDYLLLLEALQSYHGSEKINPFHEAAKRQKRFDEDPEARTTYMEENPEFDIDSTEDSEFRRKVLPMEKDFMGFMLEILGELRKNDKHNLFDDIRNKTRGENEKGGLMFPGMKDVVDKGFKDIEVLDFNQLERNIKDGMYRCWEQFQNDCFMMIANIWIFCRAVESDTELSFRAAVALSVRAMRIFKKHNNGLKRRQAAFHAEHSERREKFRRSWGKIEADKRLRGFLPDLFKERLLEADEEGEAEFKRAYPGRFPKTSLALAHWGYHARNAYEIARCAWEEDVRAARDHGYMLRMLDLAASRDVGRHFQHPPEDDRSDAHQPGGEVAGPFTVEGYLREVVWPMDLSTMRARLGAQTERDHHKLHPDTYYWPEQVQLDWFILVFNAVIYHNRFHLEVKRALDREQRPPFAVPRAPMAVRLESGQPRAFQARVAWEQPEPKPGEAIIAFEIQVRTLDEQLVEPARTLAVPGDTKRLRVDIAVDGIDTPDKPGLEQDSAHLQGGTFNICGLCPATAYEVLIRSIGVGEIFSPKSGPPLRFTTLPHVPEAPSGFCATSVSPEQVVFSWTAPRDNGADTIDYEVEYTDLLFEKIFRGRVGWNATSYSTASVLREPDGSRALSPRLYLSYQDSYLRPATEVKARVRARNSQGWGPWNQEGFFHVQTLDSNPSAPRNLAIVSEGLGYVDLAWIPPLWSNCQNGVSRYTVNVVYEEDNFEESFEFDTVQLIQNMITSPLYRPPSRTQRLSQSRGTNRRTSSLIAGRSRPGTGSSTASSDISRSLLWQPVAEDNNCVQFDGSYISEADGNLNLIAYSWWRNSEFIGELWFTSQVPRLIQHKASLDFPVINQTNNLIIFQELGPKGWEQEVQAIIPPGPYDAIQLANRTQNIFQNSVAITSSLRWNVIVQCDRFNFILNRRFRMTMAGTLAYAYGLVLNMDGWIVSPEVSSVGMSSCKSVLVAPNTHKLEATLCDLVPVCAPFIQRLAIRPGHNSQISVKAIGTIKKTAASSELNWRVCGPPSEPIHCSALAQLPVPPSNLRAEGVLGSEIVVNWVNRAQNIRAGEEIIHLELFFTLPSGVVQVRYVSPLHEGYNIGSLLPGQRVESIKVRCVSKLGPGPFSEQVTAHTKCVVPAKPNDFCLISASESSMTFAWKKPEFNGGSEIVEWEISGFLPDGSCLKERISDADCLSYVFQGMQKSIVGLSLLDVSVRCRNGIGWSKPSNKAEGQCIDCPDLYVDTRKDRMEVKLTSHKQALAGLEKAIISGQDSINAAERAAHQPARFKKALLEEAENSVILSEYGLSDAIQRSEEVGIKEMGVMQHPEDVKARELLQILRNQRTKRWGASERGPQV